MNGYARLSQLKEEMGNNVDVHDPRLLRLIPQVSRGIDNHLDRHFYALQNQTRYASAYGCGDSRVYLDFDLITPTTVKTGMSAVATYGTTLVADTDWIGYPYNRGPHEPIIALDKGPFATQLGSWPYGNPQAIQIVGTIGYSFELEATGETLTAAITDAAATSMTSSGDDIDAGEVLVIDTEQIYVSAEDANSLTIVRGVNGSVAATHLINAPIYRRRYPRDVELAATLQMARIWREASMGGSGQAGGGELGYSFSVTYPLIRDLLQPYSRKIGVA